VAHAHDLRDGLHGEAVVVGGSDGLIALAAQVFACLVEYGFLLGVALGKGCESGLGFGCLAFWSGDPRIV
jgi:hypothetical protein